MRPKIFKFPKFKPSDGLAFFPAPHLNYWDSGMKLVVLIDEGFNVNELVFNRKNGLWGMDNFAGKVIYSEMASTKPVGFHNDGWCRAILPCFRILSCVR